VTLLASDGEEQALDWIEAAVRVNGEMAEAVSELINRYVPGGVVIEQDPNVPESVTVKTFLSPDAHQTRRQIEEGLWHLGQICPIPEPRFRLVPQKGWAEAWKKQFQVLRIGHRVVIKPSWLTHSPAPDDVVVELDPGMAFGTGLHPSTRLCVQALEDLAQPDMHVLDLGTGSGILAIAAALLGAGQVLALDVDELAVKAAKTNVAVNGMADRVRVEQGSVEYLAFDTACFGLMLVNIEARVILELIDQGLLTYLGPEGWFVGSGILATQADDILAVLGGRGLCHIEIRAEDDWVAVVGRVA
jgi:ribosomal protein L11 methyltransferase